MDKMDLRSRKLKRANEAASGSAPDKKRPVRSEPHEAEARRPRGDLLAVNSGAHWWRSAVIYQIYPRSFKDTTANGIGDINGIRSKLQYIASLGVNAVWLSPVFKSPMKDFGYDISDYKDVDPLFGNLKDMKALIDEMHFLGLKLILDLVPSHSSDQHEWFIKSVKKEEPYADYYVWAKPKNATQLNKEGVIPEPPNNWVSVFGGSAWEYSPERKEFYLHQFAKEQPDLNFRNPRVVHEMKQVLRFWLQMGVDGFRIDAVPHLFEDQELRDEPRSEKEDAQEGEYDFLDHIYTHGLPEVFEIMHEFRKVMDAYAEKTDKIPRLLLAEVYDSVENTMKYYGEHDQPLVDFPFNFLFVGELDRNPTAAHLKELIDRWMDALPAGACPNWVLGNHDKGRVASRIGLHYIDSLNMVTLLLPGVAFTYYGEEIGMEDVNLTWDQTVDPAGRNAGIDNFLKASRDPARSPMQWNINKNAGFSESISTWLPVNQNYLNGVNVEDQEDRPSHLQIYRALVKLRQSETFLKGGLQTEVLNEGKVFAMSRIHGDSGILVAVNLSNERLTANLTNLEQIPEDLSIYLSTKQELNATAVKSASVKLAPHQADVLIFKVEV
ncbi:maltase 1-like isoform X2 [Neocloeon triangulifer]|uniref:maltase 1-like isoform X2 n=1 Tax=Neocloeon triangulifer TaxID=2078957 RepID=UPI00286F2350|nr:maltase 1-like isoform X2 [Neocloeon triangulifer]